MDKTSLFMLKGWPYGPVLLGAMALFALAGVIHAVGWRVKVGRPGRAVAELAFAGGAVLMAGLWLYRWRHVGHLPMQGMFEIFLLMGALVYPLFAFSRALLGARLPWSACAIALVLAFPAALVNGAGFSDAVRNLPPALDHWLFGPHVAVYMLSYVVMTLAAIHALAAIAASIFPGNADGANQQAADFESAAFNLVRFGFPLLTLGLLLGSVWGKIAWGDWWNWDPKELLSLASWLAFVGYFHFRRLYPNRLLWAGAAWIIIGELLIVWTLLYSIIEKLAAAGLHSYAA